MNARNVANVDLIKYGLSGTASHPKPTVSAQKTPPAEEVVDNIKSHCYLRLLKARLASRQLAP